MTVVYDRASADRRAAAAVVARNLGAEVRAVEEGHRCRLDAARSLFLVLSDSGARTYELAAGASVHGYLVVSCTCPAGIKGRQRPAGTLPCKHAALVARRLERADLARFDGTRWMADVPAVAS